MRAQDPDESTSLLTVEKPPRLESTRRDDSMDDQAMDVVARRRVFLGKIRRPDTGVDRRPACAGIVRPIGAAGRDRDVPALGVRRIDGNRVHREYPS